jgi:hypothetical protein
LQGAGVAQQEFILKQPREALRVAQGVPTPLRDPRLSPRGNWLAKQLNQLLDVLARMETWLTTPGERELTARDRELLQPSLTRLGTHAEAVAEMILGQIPANPSAAANHPTIQPTIIRNESTV